MSSDETAEETIGVSFSTDLLTDPVGFSVEADVSTIPAPADQALLDTIRSELVGKRRNLLFQAARVAHGSLRSYGKRHDYSVEPITETVEIQDVRQGQQSLSADIVWTHDAAQHFQFGVSPHTIDGNPILSFIWEDAPQGVREMFADTERVGGDPRVFFRSVNHPGIPASRFVQAGMNWLRQEVT